MEREYEKVLEGVQADLMLTNEELIAIVPVPEWLEQYGVICQPMDGKLHIAWPEAATAVTSITGPTMRFDLKELRFRGANGWEGDAIDIMALILGLGRKSAFVALASDATVQPKIHDNSQEQATTRHLHQTDLGNAERLVSRHGAGLRYCHPWRRWLAWDGRRWAIDDTGEIRRRAKDTTRAIYAEASQLADENARKSRAKWAMGSENRARLDAMIYLAQAETGIPVIPDELDADPSLLTVNNGTLDLRTGMLRPHDPADFITKLAPVDYDPEAEAPIWTAFLNRIMADNETLIAFLQRAVGYSLTGDVGERVLFFLYGCGANGKSTFLEAIRAMAGDYGLRTPTETLMIKRHGAIPNDVARLKGARLVTAAESDEGKRLAEAVIKDLTGGDTIAARFMRAEWFDFRPQCKIWLATNHKPEVRGTDKAIWDRIRLVPFEVIIPEAEQDKRLVEKLKKELGGILAWAVRGALEWYKHGLGIPAEVTAATAGYREEMDTLGAFMVDRCVLKPTAQGTAKALYNAYKSWCEGNGERLISKRAFGLRLAERGFKRYSDGRARSWIGIGLTQLTQRSGSPINSS